MDEFGGIRQIKPNNIGETKVAEEQNVSPIQAEPEKPVENPQVNQESPIVKPMKKKGKTKIVLIVLAIVLILLTAIALPIVNAGLKAKALYASVQVLSASIKLQDTGKIKTDLTATRNSLNDFKGSLKWVGWMKFIPFVGSYVDDVEHATNAGGYGIDAAEITLVTVEPYADILGFNKTDGSGDKTTQDRVEFIIKSLPSIIPKAGEISAKVDLAKKELDTIDPNRYPVKIGDKEVRAPMKKGLELFDEVATLVSNGKPLLEQSPYLLGIDSPRTYLVLFQNDKELRPSGGFMTAYSIMKVSKAKFEPVYSDDIYNLDAKYKPKDPAPEPIVKYIKGPYMASPNLRLRDMNWSPDFSQNMKTLLPEMEKLGVGKVDGVIAVDTQVLVNLLDVLGEIGVSGFGNYSTKIIDKCNCAQVIYELESFADVEGPVVWDSWLKKIVYAPPNMDNRKKIIGPLMNSIMSNALGQPKNKIGDLFQAAFKSLTEKHVLLYMKDEKVEQAVNSFGIAGTISNYDGDYLHINDANLGGRKSNLYATQEVEQNISVAKDGSVEKTVTITYKNPEKQDGWLNSVLPSWVRIYVPKGSQLIALEGLEDKVDPYEDLGKTVYSGLYRLRPQGVVKVTVKYKLPFKVKDQYKLFIQKQPGTNTPLYKIDLGRHSEEFFLNIDKENKFNI